MRPQSRTRPPLALSPAALRERRAKSSFGVKFMTAHLIHLRHSGISTGSNIWVILWAAKLPAENLYAPLVVPQGAATGEFLSCAPRMNTARPAELAAAQGGWKPVAELLRGNATRCRPASAVSAFGLVIRVTFLGRSSSTQNKVLTPAFRRSPV